MKLTYRKALNRGWEPVLYHTDNGQRAAAIMKRAASGWRSCGRRFQKTCVQLAEERYMRPMTSKRG